MKHLLLCIFSCIGFALFAQNKSNFKHISTGLKMGTNIGMLTLDQNNRESKTGLDLGYVLTVDFIEFRLNEKFSLNLGVGFANRKYRQVTEAVYFPDIREKAKVKESLLIQNIEIPFTFRYYLTKKKNTRQVYFSVGSSLCFNLYHQFQQEVFLQESTLEFNRQSEVDRTTFAANMNIGILFFTDYKIYYYVEPILQINPNKIDLQYGNSSKAFINIGILAGLKF